MSYALILVITSFSWSSYYPDVTLKTLDTFQTKENCLEALQELRGSGISSRAYCKEQPK